MGERIEMRAERIKVSATIDFGIDISLGTELQKRADHADQSVLIFFWLVLIFGKSMRKTVLCTWLISLTP